MVKRLGLAVMAVVGSSILIFFIMRVIPGDPVSALLAQAELGLTLEEIQAMREQFGLHLPIHEQYLKWVWDVARLDPGISLVRQTPVISDFGRAFPVTAELTVLSLTFIIVFSIVLGTITAVRQDTWLDYVVRIVAVGGLAIPVFWIGIMVILALLFWLDYTNPLVYVPFTRDPLTNLQQFFVAGVHRFHSEHCRLRQDGKVFHVGHTGRGLHPYCLRQGFARERGYHEARA